MAQLTVPNSTSVGLTRLGRDAAASADDLGPLADLVGTWMGSHGWELMAVPTHDAGAGGSKLPFRLIVRPYIEVMSFTPIGAPVPNRGAARDMFIAGLLYETRITDLVTNEPLHLENGMWLNLGDGVEPQLARLAIIPHGDALLAMGGSQTTPRAPEIPTISGLPDTGPHRPPLGYTDPYLNPVDPRFRPSEPNAVIQEAIEDLEIVKTIELSVSTLNGGGVLNIPFVTGNANAPSFTSTYWIETVEDRDSGDLVQQLQYSQQTNIEFLEQPGETGKLIVWPHVNVNTLRKQ